MGTGGYIVPPTYENVPTRLPLPKNPAPGPLGLRLRPIRPHPRPEIRRLDPYQNDWLDPAIWCDVGSRFPVYDLSRLQAEDTLLWWRFDKLNKVLFDWFWLVGSKSTDGRFGINAGLAGQRQTSRPKTPSRVFSVKQPYFYGLVCKPPKIIQSWKPQ